MKKFIGILSVAILVLQVSSVASALAVAPLSDISGSQYKTAIEYLFVKNIIGGYPDGTFKPDGQINRADLLKILVGGAGYVAPDASKYKNCFPDVKQEWFAKYVCFAKEKGWVGGFKDGLFKPNQAAVKVEAMKMLLNSEGFPKAEVVTGASIYSDVDFSQWYGPYMYVAEAMKIVNVAGAKYGPMGYVTRAEISDNIYRAMLILEQKVGSFDKVVVPNVNPNPNGGGDANPPVNPPVVIQQFDVPVLTASAVSPSSILLKWTTPIKTGDSDLKSYVLDFKLDSEVDYQSLTYAVNDYNVFLNANGGVSFASNANVVHNFRVKAVNVNGQISAYSNVATIATPKPAEPDAPIVEKISQAFSSISLKVTLPKYTGNSALDSIHSSFTNPNDGSTEAGTVSIENNNIVDSWTVNYQLFADKNKVVQPNYSFSFWVDNKSGKVSPKTIVQFEGMQAAPYRPGVEVVNTTKDEVDFNVTKPAYVGSTPITEYFFKIDSSSGAMPLSSGGGYGQNYFENTLKNVMSISGLSPNTTYVISFWVENADGKIGDKMTKTVTTSAN